MGNNKGYTVKELLEFCKQEVANGNGNKHIQISRDDEGNGFHSLFYGFTSDKESLKLLFDDGMYESFNIKNEKDLENIIILG